MTFKKQTISWSEFYPIWLAAWKEENPGCTPLNFEEFERIVTKFKFSPEELFRDIFIRPVPNPDIKQ